MKHLIILSLFIAAIINLQSCSKEGVEGPAGKDGNANVKSTTFVVTPAQWQVSSSGGGALGEISCSLTDTNLTRGILDSGSVEVFQQLGVSQPLPITDVGTTPWGNPVTITTAHFSQNTVAIHRFRTDDSLPPVPNYNTTYKVVVIE